MAKGPMAESRPRMRAILRKREKCIAAHCHHFGAHHSGKP
jgi:hypothetical protein